MRRTLFLALCAVFLSAPASAQQVCTEIGCMNGLAIDMQGTDWEAGHYVFTFLLNNKIQVECDGTLPLKSCDKGPSFNCNVEGVTIGESGCALLKNAHSLSGVQMNGAPYKVVMNVTKNGKPFIGRTFKPDYVTSQPNGPNCGPVCHSATVSLNKAPQAQ